MAAKYKIAVIQLYPEPMQNEGNHARALSYIRTAASSGAHLAILPEYHLDSWVPSDPSFHAHCAQHAKYLASYQRIARELSICIVPGTIVEAHGDDLLNVAYFIGSDGEILGRYQKKNLWHPERPHLTGSMHEPHEAFETPVGKVGMLICWDLAFPEAFRELIAAGAKIIIIPTFWTDGDCSEKGLRINPQAERLFLSSTVVSRTFENTCAVVFCNAGGPKGATKPGTYCGMSQVAVPFAGSLGTMGEEEEMRVYELDMQILEDAEENYKVREDIGTEGWHYEYTLTRNESNATEAKSADVV